MASEHEDFDDIDIPEFLHKHHTENYTARLVQAKAEDILKAFKKKGLVYRMSPHSRIVKDPDGLYLLFHNNEVCRGGGQRLVFESPLDAYYVWLELL